MPNAQVYTYPARGVVSIIGIDVNATLFAPYSDPSGAGRLTAPLNNIVGGLAQDSFAAGELAIDLLASIAGAALCLYVFFVAGRRAREAAGSVKYFGLRTALVFFTISRFFAWLYLAIPNSMALPRGYIALSMVPLFFRFAADTTLLWTLARTVCQPLVAATGYKRSRGIGLGFTIPYGIIALASWALMLTSLVFFFDSEWRFYSNRYSYSPISSIIDLALGCMGVLWGFVYVGISVRAVRQTRDTLEPAFQAVPTLALFASSVWVVRSGLTVIGDLGVWDLIRDAGYVYRLSPLISAICIDVLGLVLFGLLVACYRPHLMTLYTDAASARSKEQAVQQA